MLPLKGYQKGPSTSEVGPISQGSSQKFQEPPKSNLSVVLNELTKAPFEPMKDTDLKHLTHKTVFLLALASGKHRNEIHASVANKASNLGQWEKVTLFPSSDFIAKKPTSKRRFSKCVSSDYPCFDYDHG